MNIHELATDDGEDVFYDPDFHIVLESHMTYLKMLPGTRMMMIEPQVAYRNEGDFNGVLDELRVPKQHHWLTMRMNDLRSPNDFTADMQSIIVPDYAEVDLIRSVYQTKTTGM